MGDLLALQPDMARRTAQRWISQLLDKGRRTYHDVIQRTIRDVVQALIIDALRRLHEGVLARYG